MRLAEILSLEREGWRVADFYDVIEGSMIAIIFPSLSADQHEHRKTPVAPRLVGVCAGRVLQVA